MKDYLKQEPRSPSFFMSDVSDAVESLNAAALDHAGKDYERYIAFLKQASEGALCFAEDAERELELKRRRDSHET